MSATLGQSDNQELRAAAITAAFTSAALLLFLNGIARVSYFMQDEQTYVPSARALISSTSRWTMDHPPLAKSLIAVGIRFVGDNPLGWRVASAAAGSLVLAAIMLLTYVLLRSVEYMIVAGCLTLLDNFWFVMSRIAMLDTLLMLFLFWGILLFLAGTTTAYARRSRHVCLILSGILLGLAASCKWNALFSIAALLLIGCVLYARHRNFSLPVMLVSLSVFPALAYAITFLPLFRAIGRPFTLSALISTQREMYILMKSLTGNDFINVPWFRWPFQIEPQRGLSYLVGNYAVMFGGLLALGICAWRLCRRFFRPRIRGPLSVPDQPRPVAGHPAQIGLLLLLLSVRPAAGPRAGAGAGAMGTKILFRHAPGLAAGARRRRHLRLQLSAHGQSAVSLGQHVRLLALGPPGFRHASYRPNFRPSINLSF